MATGVNSSISKSKRIFISTIPFCKYCGATKDLVIDHIFPPSKGGNSDLENLTRCCLSCNSMKIDMTINEWKEVIIYRIEEGNRRLDRYKKILLALESESYKMVV